MEQMPDLNKHMRNWEIEPCLDILRPWTQKPSCELWIRILFGQLHRYISQEQEAAGISLMTTKAQPDDSEVHFEYLKSLFYMDDPYMFNFELNRFKKKLTGKHLRVIDAYDLNLKGRYRESNEIVSKECIFTSGTIENIDLFDLYVLNLYTLDDPDWIRATKELNERWPKCPKAVYWMVKVLSLDNNIEEIDQLVDTIDNTLRYDHHSVLNQQSMAVLSSDPLKNGHLVSINDSVYGYRNWAVTEVCDVLSFTHVFLHENEELGKNDYFLDLLTKNSVCNVRQIPKFLIELYPKVKHPEVLKNLGHIYFKTGSDYKKATEYYEKYIEQKPQNVRVLKNLKSCYSHLNNTEMQELVEKEIIKLRSKE